MFNKYNSIENSYRKEFLERLEREGLLNETYVVQEKVHGSNLSYFTTDGVNFRGAKRNGIIENGEQFYNFDVVLEALQPKFEMIWNLLQNKYDNIEQLTIFGEIFGGSFSEVLPKNKTAKKVQKGIYYSPNNHFYAFDVLINTNEYVDVDTANELFEQVEVFYAKTLFRGNLDECLHYPNVFNSLIPKWLGLPELENNICEGTVIRPVKPHFLVNGSRVILKNKNEKWSENKRFYKSFKEKEPLPEKIVKLQEAAETYVTENRLNNVLSKLGEVTQKDFGKILGLFNKDILQDFAKDYGKILKELDKKEQKLINKSASTNAAKLIREYFKR